MKLSSGLLPEEARTALFKWYRDCGRALPWRLNREPYPVWISEIMCQQTTVGTVIPYFERWLARFPSVEDLAAAEEHEAFGIWQGLGYYRRCQTLLDGARIVSSKGWPKSYAEWLKIPGVGVYTAGAISSICLHESVPAVDGNVERVFARLAAHGDPKLSAAAREWARLNMDAASPGEWNQALMELGAVICRPKNPLCSQCPISTDCEANRLGSPTAFPAREKRAAPKQMRQVISVPYFDGRFGIIQTNDQKWWRGLWTLPSFARGAAEPNDPRSIGEVRFTVTHHRIRAEVLLDIRDRHDPDVIWLTCHELRAIALPAPHRRALEMAGACLKVELGETAAKVI